MEHRIVTHIHTPTLLVVVGAKYLQIGAHGLALLCDESIVRFGWRQTSKRDSSQCL